MIKDGLKDKRITCYNCDAKKPNGLSKKFVDFWHKQGCHFVDADTGEEMFGDGSEK